VKVDVAGQSTKCCFKGFVFVWVLAHDKIEKTNSCERSECIGLPVLSSACLQEVRFESSPSDMKRDPFDAV
jgi:hypothetical protein